MQFSWNIMERSLRMSFRAGKSLESLGKRPSDGTLDAKDSHDEMDDQGRPDIMCTYYIWIYRY